MTVAADPRRIVSGIVGDGLSSGVFFFSDGTFRVVTSSLLLGDFARFAESMNHCFTEARRLTKGC